MINFFRKIRKKLTDDNKPLKYMRYAVGEILLVVIGILIAIQVDNWNEQRKDHRELSKILEGILVDMKTDIINLNEEIGFLEERNKRVKLFIDHRDYNEFSRDSLEQGLETYYYKFPWRTSSFEKLRNSDITDYVEYEEVIGSIEMYYTFVVPLRKYREDYDMGDMVRRADNFWRFEQNSYELNNPKGLHNNAIGLQSYQSNEKAKNELIILLRSPKVRNILKTNYRKKTSLITDYKNVKSDLEKIVKELENVLK